MSDTDPAPGNVLPAPIQIYQLAIGHYRSRALALVTKLGIADAIAAGTRSVPALASETRADPSALRRVLRLLVSVGVFSPRSRPSGTLTSSG